MPGPPEENHSKRASETKSASSLGWSPALNAETKAPRSAFAEAAVQTVGRSWRADATPAATAERAAATTIPAARAPILLDYTNGGEPVPPPAVRANLT